MSGARAEGHRRGAVEAVAEIDQLERVAGPVAIQQGAQVGERLQPGVVQAHEHVARLQARPRGPESGTLANTGRAPPPMRAITSRPRSAILAIPAASILSAVSDGRW